MDKLELFKDIISNEMGKKVYSDTLSFGLPNLNTIEQKLVIEIVPIDFFYYTNIEFFILSSFQTVKKKIDDEISEDEVNEKWIFHKILIMNENIENVFENYKMNKVKVHEIKVDDDKLNVSPLVSRHLTQTLTQGKKYKILLDEIQFETFFINKNQTQYND